MSDVFGKCKRMYTTPEIVMLRRYEWGWHDGAQNIIGIWDGFIHSAIRTYAAYFIFETYVRILTYVILAYPAVPQTPIVDVHRGVYREVVSSPMNT